jgi:hypothetical protein
LLTDGERRYGNFLFAACCRALYTGKPGQPTQTLPEGVKVRLKNKGLSPDSSRPKYEAPPTRASTDGAERGRSGNSRQSCGGF